MNMHRRSFIKWTSLAAAGNVIGLQPFGTLNALAQEGTDYKALVCIFLYGGNDSNNMIVPADSRGYANYATLRGPLALPQSSLLPLEQLPQYAFHPDMPELQGLFDSGKAAIVANVGTLASRMTRSQLVAGASLPAALLSHAAQQEEWQSATPQTSSFTGWGGRVGDALSSSYNPAAAIPMNTTVDGNVLFSNGASTYSISVPPGSFDFAACSEGAECAARLASTQRILQMNSGISLVTAESNIGATAFSTLQALRGSISAAPGLQTVFPSGPLAAQLKQVAQVIQVHSSLGMRRQIFFCGLQGFDTHGSQLESHAALLAQLSQAIYAFYQATQELGVQNQVVSFTMSDFSRTLQPNSSAGSDHAWGSHQLVVGGAVKGSSLYGTFPTLALGGPDDFDSTGRWIPTTATVQYASTLSSWFGVPATQLATIFPTLGSFGSSDLGFL